MRTRVAEDVDTIVRTTFGSRPGLGASTVTDRAGPDVRAEGCRTPEDALGERMAAKTELTACRDRTCSHTNDLLRGVGPAPRGS